MWLQGGLQVARRLVLAEWEMRPTSKYVPLPQSSTGAGSGPVAWDWRPERKSTTHVGRLQGHTVQCDHAQHQLGEPVQACQYTRPAVGAQPGGHGGR